MMVIKNMGDGSIYVGFPVYSDSYSDAEYPPGVKEWLMEQSIPIRPGVLKGRQTGIFLDGQDAMAFKLKFGL
jgi:hypothetical protein